jgi:hypothetical protein
MKQHTITGTNQFGNVLSVTLYARDADDAARIYDFRYKALGYVRQQQQTAQRRRTITL